MKNGDMVRFAMWGEFDHMRSTDWDEAPKNHIGILIEYDNLMKSATILYEGKLHKVRAQLVQKAGKKDYT